MRPELRFFNSKAGSIQIVLTKYRSIRQAPANISFPHLPIAVESQSQPKELSEQNSSESQLSIFKKLHPFYFPHVVFSA